MDDKYKGPKNLLKKLESVKNPKLLNKLLKLPTEKRREILEDYRIWKEDQKVLKLLDDKFIDSDSLSLAGILKDRINTFHYNWAKLFPKNEPILANNILGASESRIQKIAEMQVPNYVIIQGIKLPIFSEPFENIINLEKIKCPPYVLPLIRGYYYELEIVNTKLRLTKIVDSSYSTPFYSSLKNFQFENVDYLILLLEKSDKALTLLDLYFKDFYYVVGNYLLLDFQFGELSVKGKNYKKYKEIKIKNDLLDKLNNLLNTSEPKLQDYGLNYFEDCVDKMYGNDLLNRFKRLFYSEEYKKSLVARCELVKLYEKDFNEYQETYKNIVNQLKEFVGEPNYYYGTDELNAYKKLLVRSIPKSNNYVTTIEYQKRVIKSRFKYEIRKIQSIQKDLLKNERSYWLGLSGHDFEKAVTQLFFKVDLNPYLTSGSDDHGIDIILTVADMQIPVQCKNHSKPMSPSAIRDFQGASSTRFQSQKSIFISSNSYSPKAVQQASLSGMLLLDVDSLLQINIQKGYDYTKLINYLK